MKSITLLFVLISVCSSKMQAQNSTASIGTMYFGNQPFTVNHDNSKSVFTSGEFIYGRLELNSGTVKDVFKIREDKDKKPLSLFCEVSVYHKGKKIGYVNSWKYFLLKEDDQNRSGFNFDVLPEPSRASSVLTGSPGFRDGLASAPLYSLFNKDHFPESGQYVIKTEFYKDTYDAYGNREPMEKWIVVDGEFNFTFNISDVSTLLNNAKQADETAAQNAFRYSQLPEIFSHSAKLNDPAVSTAKIMAILKRDLPRVVPLKIAIDYPGSTLWVIEKNSLDIPIQKKLWATIYMAYKRDGNCYIGTVELVEKYQGGGQYGSLSVGYTSERDRGIDCNKVK